MFHASHGRGPRVRQEAGQELWESAHQPALREGEELISCFRGHPPEGVQIMASNYSNPGKLMIKSKVWIEDENGKVVFGSGRLRILELVEQYGSIHAAAKELKMSYRAVWGKIKATEDRLGQSLVRRKPDGARRGGSELTPFAGTIMEGYRHLQLLVENEADHVFQDTFSSGMNRETTSPTVKK
jgi:molybdate transport system regulatory protein